MEIVRLVAVFEAAGTLWFGGFALVRAGEEVEDVAAELEMAGTPLVGVGVMACAGEIVGKMEMSEWAAALFSANDTDTVFWSSCVCDKTLTDRVCSPGGSAEALIDHDVSDPGNNSSSTCDGPCAECVCSPVSSAIITGIFVSGFCFQTIMDAMLAAVLFLPGLLFKGMGNDKRKKVLFKLPAG